MSRYHPRNCATDNTHPDNEEPKIIPSLPCLSTLGQLRSGSHRCSPSVLENSNQTPEVNHRQRDVVEQKTRDNPDPRVAGTTIGVAGIVVEKRVGDTDADVVPVEVSK